MGNRQVFLTRLTFLTLLQRRKIPSRGCPYLPLQILRLLIFPTQAMLLDQMNQALVPKAHMKVRVNISQIVAVRMKSLQPKFMILHYYVKYAYKLSIIFQMSISAQISIYSD